MFSEKKIITPIFIWIKCKIGWHTWGEIEKELVQITGPHILFFSWGKQNGKRKCIHCQYEQKLYRSGFVGAGCQDPPWEKY